MRNSASGDVGISKNTESYSSPKKCNNSNFSDVCDVPKVKEDKEFDEAEFFGGVIPGKTIKICLNLE